MSEFSVAGFLTPTPSSLVTAQNSGNLANQLCSLLPIGMTGTYGLVLNGWSFPQIPGDQPLPVQMAVLLPDAQGNLMSGSPDAIPDTTNFGSNSVIVADFNADGAPDIVLVAHNEHPFVPEPGVAFMSRAGGGFDRVALPAITQAHDAQLVTINGAPAILTATFYPGDSNPILTYSGGAWHSATPTILGQVGGQSSTLAQFGKAGAYELVRSDISTAWVNGSPNELQIVAYRFDAQTLDITTANGAPERIQTITPYLSTLSQYQTYASYWGQGLTHVYRLWNDDLNHDGHIDVLAGQSMWNTSRQDYPSALQVLINRGDGTFIDRTATLNPDMSLNTDELDYSPSVIDLDHSGINSYLFGNTTYQTATRQSNYLILNDGTGRLYVALHNEFEAWGSQVSDYLHATYTFGGGGYYFNETGGFFPKFIGIPQPNGSIRYVVQSMMMRRLPDSGLTQVLYPVVNTSFTYNPATDFKQSVTIGNRNGSTLLRTWAGNDVVSDTGAAGACHINGGLGSNMAIYSGKFAGYTLTMAVDGAIGVKSISAPVAVDDTLVNFSLLRFADAQMAVGTSNAVLVARPVDQLLFGGAGNDVLVGSARAEVLRGGAGSDTADYRQSTSGVTVTLATATAQNTLGGGADTLAGIENLKGSAYNDVLKGNAAANTLAGDAGSDRLDGGDGRDTLNGGTGADKMFGGAGNDTYYVDDIGDRVYETATASSTDLTDLGGADTVLSSISLTLGRFIENLALAGTVNLNGIGNELANRITGNDGANTLRGLAGNDTLTGGAGDDKLSGGDGKDTLSGGTGKDYFIFNTAPTIQDLITDFNHAEGDIIQLSKTTFTAFRYTGALHEDDFYAAAGATKAHDVSDRIVYNTATGILYYDADGTGGAAAVQIAQLGASTHSALVYGDLQIIV